MPSENSPPEARIFVSYAHRNESLALKFVDCFREQTDAARNYEYGLWDDRQIVAGEDWLGEIQRAIRRCHLGMMLISPSFLGSPFIKRHELSRFTGDSAKPVIPVILQPVDFRTHNSLGLEKKQCFRLKHRGQTRSFAECTTGNLKSRFAYRLLLEVERRLGKLGLS